MSPRLVLAELALGAGAEHMQLVVDVVARVPATLGADKKVSEPST
jgi:hypothetical protein